MARTQPREKKVSVRLHDVNWAIDFHLEIAIEELERHVKRVTVMPRDEFYEQQAHRNYDIAREVACLVDERCRDYKGIGWPLFYEWETWVLEVMKGESHEDHK
jgi:hypothetical protein